MEVSLHLIFTTDKDQTHECRRDVNEQHAEERLQTAFSEVEDVRKEKEEVERRLRRCVFIAHRPLTWNVDPNMEHRS